MIAIKSALSNFENEIENMTEEEKRTEKPYEIEDIVEKVLEFNTEFFSSIKNLKMRLGNYCIFWTEKKACKKNL